MVGIVTVVTNEVSNLDNFFDSLDKQTFKDFILYFVDNNSSDNSAGHFQTLNKSGRIRTEYIFLNKNSGFSGGSNRGAEKASRTGCKYLFILNNDVVLENTCLEKLVKFMESHNDAAAVSPLLFRHKTEQPGVIQEFGGKIDFKKGRLTKNYTNRNINEINFPEYLETDFVGGGVCFIRSDIFSNVGMFEESYFAYFDEIDLSKRLKDKNCKLYALSTAVAYHNHIWKKKNNTGYYFEYYLNQRNKFLYLKKYKFHTQLLLILTEDIAKFPWRYLWFLRVCDYKLGLYYLIGTYHGLLGKKGKPWFLENKSGKNA